MSQDKRRTFILVLADQPVFRMMSRGVMEVPKHADTA